MAVITCAILMSIGSNVLEIELCAPVVYFALGRAVRILTGPDTGTEQAGAAEVRADSAANEGGAKDTGSAVDMEGSTQRGDV